MKLFNINKHKFKGKYFYQAKGLGFGENAVLRFASSKDHNSQNPNQQEGILMASVCCKCWSFTTNETGRLRLAVWVESKVKQQAKLLRNIGRYKRKVYVKVVKMHKLPVL